MNIRKRSKPLFEIFLYKYFLIRRSGHERRLTRFRYQSEFSNFSLSGGTDKSILQCTFCSLFLAFYYYLHFVFFRFFVLYRPVDYLREIFIDRSIHCILFRLLSDLVIGMRTYVISAFESLRRKTVSLNLCVLSLKSVRNNYS